MAKVIQKDG